MLLVAGNMLPVSRQHVSLYILQQTGNNFVDGNKQHVAGQHVAWCKRGLRQVMIISILWRREYIRVYKKMKNEYERSIVGKASLLGLGSKILKTH